MSEDALWTNVRGKLAPFGRVVRIENRCDEGTPDTHYALLHGRHVGWMELKHSTRVVTPLLIESLTLEQITWHEDEIEAGGSVCTLWQLVDEYAMLDSLLLRHIFERRVTYESLRYAFPERIARSLTPGWLFKWL